MPQFIAALPYIELTLLFLSLLLLRKRRKLKPLSSLAILKKSLLENPTQWKALAPVASQDNSKTYSYISASTEVYFYKSRIYSTRREPTHNITIPAGAYTLVSVDKRGKMLSYASLSKEDSTALTSILSEWSDLMLSAGLSDLPASKELAAYTAGFKEMLERYPQEAARFIKTDFLKKEALEVLE